MAATNYRKNVLSCILVIGLALEWAFNPVKAQGTLQFNQVVLVTTSGGTVPVGKVWKVEAALYAGYSGVCLLSGDGLYHSYTLQGLLVNSVFYMPTNPGSYYSQGYSDANCSVASGSAQNTGGIAVTGMPMFPFWLPATSTVKAVGPGTSISVIEYNIIH